MKTLNQRLTNKAKVQFTAANKVWPSTVSLIRFELKKIHYVHDLNLFTASDLCNYVFDCPINISVIVDAFKPLD